MKRVKDCYKRALTHTSLIEFTDSTRTHWKVPEKKSNNTSQAAKDKTQHITFYKIEIKKKKKTTTTMERREKQQCNHNKLQPQNTIHEVECEYTKEDIASGRVQVIGICYFFPLIFCLSLALYFSTIPRQFILYAFISNSCCAICRKDFQTFVTYSVNIFTSTVSTEPKRLIIRVSFG